MKHENMASRVYQSELTLFGSTSGRLMKHEKWTTSLGCVSFLHLVARKDKQYVCQIRGFSGVVRAPQIKQSNRPSI